MNTAETMTAEYRNDWEQMEAADRLLGEAASAIERRDAEGAGELLADAVAALDLLGQADLDRPEPRARNLGSRLVKALRGIRDIRTAEMDAELDEQIAAEVAGDELLRALELAPLAAIKPVARGSSAAESMAVNEASRIAAGAGLRASFSRAGDR